MSARNGYGFSSSASIFLAGACIGAGIALLLAPQSGAQLRTSLRGYAERTKDELNDAWESAVDSGKEYVERGKEYIEEGQEALMAAGKMVDKAIHQGKKFVKNAL